jgi:hypothetical protein
MIGAITSAGLYSGFTVETTLDPNAQPFLFDHQIDGTPVLPGVMGVEAFAETALLLLPGWRIEAIEDVNFLAPFKFYRKEPRTLNLQARFRRENGSVVAECSLIGRRILPGQTEAQVSTHFTARVRLTPHEPEQVNAPAPGEAPGSFMTAADIYRIYFHGPAYQVVEGAWIDDGRTIGKLPQSLPPNHYPPELPLAFAPRLIESCFQTAGLWEMAVNGTLGLPNHIERVRVLRSPDSAEGRLFALVSPDPERGTFDAQVVDSGGNCYVQLSGYRTVTLSNVEDPEPLRALQAAMVAGV